MKVKYLILTIPFLAYSCNIELPWLSSGPDISQGISLSEMNDNLEGDVYSEETNSTREFNNSLVIFFEKTKIEGNSKTSEKKIYEYLKSNSEEVHYTEKIIKDYANSTVKTGNQQPYEENIVSDIEGQTFVYKKVNNRWNVNLLNKNPTPKQREIIKDLIIEKNNSCKFSGKDRIKLGEKIEIDPKKDCLFGLGKIGKFNKLSISFNDTSTVDGKLYAYFLIFGEMELSVEKYDRKVESGTMQEERKLKNAFLKADFIGKFIYCVNDNFTVKEEMEITAKGKSIREIYGEMIPVDTKVTGKTIKKRELLRRKK